jgi:hypothetical protein
LFLRPRCLRGGQDGPAPAQEFEGVETVPAAEIDRRQGVIALGRERKQGEHLRQERTGGDRAATSGRPVWVERRRLCTAH